MEREERQIIHENYLEQVHSKALAVCEHLAEGKVLRTALSLAGITAREFYQARRDHQDVQKAHAEAQEILAELKFSDMDDLSSQLISEEGLTVGTYTAITKNEKWAIEKLNPERYGSKPSAVPTYVQNNVQVLQTLTDQQILDIVNGGGNKLRIEQKEQQDQQELRDQQELLEQTPAVLEHVENKALDNIIEPEYKEISGDTSRDLSGTVCLHNNHAATQAPTSTPSSSSLTGAYDLSAFGDLS